MTERDFDHIQATHYTEACGRWGHLNVRDPKTRLLEYHSILQVYFKATELDFASACRSAIG